MLQDAAVAVVAAALVAIEQLQHIHCCCFPSLLLLLLLLRLLLLQVGEQRAFDFPVRDHVSLGEALGILDFETAAEVGFAEQIGLLISSVWQIVVPLKGCLLPTCCCNLL
jgi:hypothetical protein